MALFDPQDHDDDILTADEVADWLRLPPDVVRRYAAEGKIPASRIGHRWRFSRAAIAAWFSAGGMR